MPPAGTAVSIASDGLWGHREVAETVGLSLAGLVGRSLGPARRRRRRRDGISPLELFLAPLAFLSGVIGELVEVVLPLWSFFSGGLRRRLVVL